MSSFANSTDIKFLSEHFLVLPYLFLSRSSRLLRSSNQRIKYTSFSRIQSSSYGACAALPPLFTISSTAAELNERNDFLATLRQLSEKLQVTLDNTPPSTDRWDWLRDFYEDTVLLAITTAPVDGHSPLEYEFGEVGRRWHHKNQQWLDWMNSSLSDSAPWGQ